MGRGGAVEEEEEEAEGKGGKRRGSARNGQTCDRHLRSSHPWTHCPAQFTCTHAIITHYIHTRAFKGSFHQ